MLLSSKRGEIKLSCCVSDDERRLAHSLIEARFNFNRKSRSKRASSKRGLPSQVKGAALRRLSCRGSWVQIPPPALFNERNEKLNKNYDHVSDTSMYSFLSPRLGTPFCFRDLVKKCSFILVCLNCDRTAAIWLSGSTGICRK